ncbi:unnamed protein product (macronuclear) [Paramecium tetraurelia]|uniref:Uncharacterized protein n=1 Tax=Paramecium tetraurelia TaxID=5888 RepID=A0E6X1_PARTE|nr:uncharacterized protein GSPATT00023766001 [Paramecium tetraurelia]CAK91038.1 unnamed protein product [Paramecium tetraurelia]|eukprot:XP_001458435.1 hypothetical protein (macronuclear) [Paramecium tetraurelia strain d4-2]
MFSERVAKAQGRNCHSQNQDNPICHTVPKCYKQSRIYILLKQTKPYNNTHKRPKTTVEATKYLFEEKEKQKVLNRQILQHITGTSHDYFKAKKEGKIAILKMRTETQLQDLVSGGSVKIINGHELTQPQFLHSLLENRAKSAFGIKCTTIPNISETRAQISQYSRLIVPLEKQKLKSMQSYGILNHELQMQNQRHCLRVERTFNHLNRNEVRI